MPNSAELMSNPSALPIAHPLDDFYVLAGEPLPKIRAVDPDGIPEPYKSLLVHNQDMTSTLERYYGSKIGLDVIQRQQRSDYYFREVVLVTERDERPVEFGAIKINLGLFNPVARRQILEEQLPLGYILHQNIVQHASRPKAYIQILSDGRINSALGLTGNRWMFGRRNTLLDPHQRPLAEIVEILPPA